MKYITLIVTLLALLAASARAGNWELLPGTESIKPLKLASDGIRLYAASYRHGMHLSDDDGGESWAPKNVGLLIPADHNWLQGDLIYPDINQILVTESRMVIAVGYLSGTHISRDRGETWHYPLTEWVWVRDPEFNKKHGLPPWKEYVAFKARSMVEFGGYLWASLYAGFPALLRSPDDGDTWEKIPYWSAPRLALAEYGATGGWAVRHNQLYAAGEYGFARWNEAEQAREDFSRGLPPPYKYLIHTHHEIQVLAVNRNRIFAGLRENGVWTIDKRSETWTPVGLEGLTVRALVSHQSELYALTREGIFRATILVVQPHGKSATTWGAIKQKQLSGKVP